MTETNTFYDSFTDYYHLIHENWDQVIIEQGETLKKIFSPFLSPKKLNTSTLLDCTCGIGTQALGLKMSGLNVWGSDISSHSISRAKKEATKRQLPLVFQTCDVRELSAVFKQNFDLIYSWDNSLTHLTSSADMLKAFQAIYATLASDGIFFMSLRDYDQLVLSKPNVSPLLRRKDVYGDRLYFQTWDWKNKVHQGESWSEYDFTLYLVFEKTHQVLTSQSVFRAWQRNELQKLLEIAGFQSSKVILPEESGFSQPIIMGHKK
jgi:glycine/sarcosine N-methyltransferase